VKPRRQIFSSAEGKDMVRIVEVVFDQNCEVTHEAFGALIREDQLVVPAELRLASAGGHPQSLVQFLVLVHRYPDSVSAMLKWTPEQVDTARQRLFQLLDGKIEGRFLESPSSVV
jgi:hypothetical protein